MKRKQTSIGVIIILFLLTLGYQDSIAQNLDLDWVAQISGRGEYGYAIVSSVAVDRNNNVFAVGNFTDTIEVVTLSDGLVSLVSKGGNDMFIAKIDPTGAVVWIKQVGGKGNLGHTGQGDLSFNHWFSIKLDQDDNLYITGNFKDTVDFDPGPADVLRNSSLRASSSTLFYENTFVLKLNNDGEFVWVRTLYGGQNSASAIAFDHEEGTWSITGYFRDVINMDDGKVIHTLSTPASGLTNVFVIKYDTSGSFIWARQMGNKRSNEGLDIHIDDGVYVYTTGSFSDSADFDPGAGNAYLVSTAKPGPNVFVSKLDAKGDYVWAKAIGSISNASGARGAGITTDSKGNVYTTGYFQATGNFDPNQDPKHTIVPRSNLSYFLSKLDADGNYVWANALDRPPGRAGTDYGAAVQVNKRGEVFTTGYFYGYIYLDSDGNNATREVFQSGGSNDAFVLKVNPDGTFAWAKTFKSSPTVGSSRNRAFGLLLSPGNDLYVNGYFRGEVDFNPSGAAYNLTSLSSGYIDGCVAKLICNDTSSSTIAVDICADKYELLGKSYTVSGDYIVVTTNTSGCDSSIFLSLILNEMPVPVINVNGFKLGTAGSYATYQWLYDDQPIEGAISRNYTVTENGPYRVVVSTEEGCSDTSDVYNVNNVTHIGNYSSLADKIEIYPNPSADIIHISAPIGVTVQLVSIEGKVLINKKEAKEISLKGFSSGIYFLNMLDKAGNLVKVEKIIKD